MVMNSSTQRNNCVKYYEHKHISTTKLKHCVLNTRKCPIYLAEQGAPSQRIHTSGKWKVKAGKELLLLLYKVYRWYADVKAYCLGHPDSQL